MKGLETIYAQTPKELDETLKQLQREELELLRKKHDEFARIGESNVERGRAIVRAFDALTSKDILDGDKVAIEILRDAINNFGDR